MLEIFEAEKRIKQIQALISLENSFSSKKLHDLAIKLGRIFDADHKVAFVGNGGSAAEAIHLAAEFTGRCVLNHRPLPALCLNESQSALTAIANDFGIEEMFSRQVQAHLRRGDLLIVISTSGKSLNILNAIKTALEKEVEVILWMGDFDGEFEGVDVWRVPSISTPRIQEVHLMWGHILAELVELNMQ